MAKGNYTLSRKARAQRLAASKARAAASPRREFATVRIERRVRDSAQRVLRADESLASLVGAAVSKEIDRRS